MLSKYSNSTSLTFTSEVRLQACENRVDFTLPVLIHLDPRANLGRQEVVKLAAILITLVRVG